MIYSRDKDRAGYRFSGKIIEKGGGELYIYTNSKYQFNAIKKNKKYIVVSEKEDKNYLVLKRLEE